jgi:uncharacterized membrane protein YgcG
MRPRLRRARRTWAPLLLAAAALAALPACSSDLFHSTDWPTRCDAKPDDPGCPATTSSSSASSTGASSSSSAASSSSSAGGGGQGGAGGTSSSGAMMGAGGAMKDGG